jgi:aldehyde:ferredoxin oxidoreductase
MPGRENGKWRYIKTLGRSFDKNKFEEFKSLFYKQQGWETSTGYPTASTLKSLGLDYVAAELEQNGKLGKG